MNRAFEIIVYGRVQGVGYRFFAARKARLYQIKGYVKNLANGSVKVLAIGENENLNAFISCLRKGPDYSWVADIHKSELKAYQEYNDFEIIR